ncbi:hypothetical protein ACIBEJ_23075 [Nonomuraea sp. NPDC050790]|uniref:hypothetical protein n=1 Tax=Nonomuraea sp. NPDC050790 TaxID=3364371 RepID=UPI0037A09CC3
MSLLRRLPADVRKSLATEPGERVLAFAASGEGYVVATDLALFLPGGVRLPYETIDRAAWSEDGVLNVATTAGERHQAPVSEPRRLPETIRERVNATIVVNKHVQLPGRGGVRLVARRPPGGEVKEWTLVFDEGLDPHDPGLRAQAEQALEGVRRSMGV